MIQQLKELDVVYATLMEKPCYILFPPASQLKMRQEQKHP
jgi:hypothetical protein